MAESMTKHEAIRFFYPLDLASCTRIIGMGMAMECTHLHKYTSRVNDAACHSIVAPRYPWSVKNKLAMRSVPDPCEGAGTQTKHTGGHSIACSLCAIYSTRLTLFIHCITSAKRTHEVQPAVLDGESSTQLLMYSLDTGIRYSTYLPLFKSQKCSIEALNFS